MNLRSAEGLAQFVEANKGNVAFLRFKCGGLKQGKYSDWDIAVRDRTRGIEACEKLYQQAWLRIPRQYVIQHYYDWGQCDLLPVFEWNGFEYLESELFWSEVQQSEDGIPRPAFGHDAYIAWMTGLLWGRRFDRRYRDFIQLAAREDEQRFRQCLEAAFGAHLAQRLYRIAERGDAAVATHWVGEMRAKLALRRFVNAPIKTINRVLAHWWCEMKFHWRLPFPWIGLLGPDGSGKSTVIHLLTQKVRKSRLKFFVVHWIPALSLGTSSAQGPVTDPHAQAAKSSFLSYLQLGKIIGFWWWATVRYLIHLRAKRELVFSDRFYLDLLADPKRYRFGASRKIAQWLFKLLPKPDRVIVLHSTPDVILSRKEEVSREELERQLESYRQIVKTSGNRATLVDCGKPPEEVADEIFREILKELSKRSR